MEFELALRILETAKSVGRERGVQCSVAIVCAAGHPVLVARGKEEAWHGPYMATGKARLSSAFRKPTKQLVELWADRPMYANSLNGVLPGGVTLNPGGYPLFEHGRCIGAIGIGGSAPPIGDEIARTTVERMQMMPVKDSAE